LIPLNKPVRVSYEKNGDGPDLETYIGNHFENYFFKWTYSSRNGLDIIYQQLYMYRGSLKIGVSPLTCFEALYPILSNKHKIVFIDIDKETFNLDENLLQNYKDIDVLQAIHLGGNPQRMHIISDWARINNKIVVEDCAQSLGSFYKDKHIGSFGDFSVFSLVKNLQVTTGSLLLSKLLLNIKTEEYVPTLLLQYKRLKKFLESHCSYSKTNPANFMLLVLLYLKEKRKNYNFSINYQLPLVVINEIEKKIRFLDSLNNRRKKISERIIHETQDLEIKVQNVPDKGISNRNRLIFKSLNIPARDIINRLRKKGIAANNLTQNYLQGFQDPINKNETFQKFFIAQNLPHYLEIHPFLFSVPNSPALNLKEVNHIIKSLRSLIS